MSFSPSDVKLFALSLKVKKFRLAKDFWLKKHAHICCVFYLPSAHSFAAFEGKKRREKLNINISLRE